MKRKAGAIIIALILIYLLTGFLFTILRSNAHYNFFIVKEDPLGSNGKTYWENRCIVENVNKPGTEWCKDSSGEFKTEIPTKFGWYFFFYSKQPTMWVITLLLYPLHFFGFDMINYKGLGSVWSYG